ALEPGRHGEHQQQEAEHEIVIGALVDEFELPEIIGLDRDIEAHRSAERGCIERNVAGDLGEGERHQREVGALDTIVEAQVSDEQPERGRDNAAHEHADPGADASVQQQQSGSISPGGHEQGMTERELTGKAAKNVPAIGQIGEQQDLDQDMRLMRGGDERKACQHDDRGEPGCECANSGHRAGAAKSPSGLNSSTRMKIRKGSTGAVEPGMNNAPSDSAIATTKLANKAPMKFPIPPSTTTTKAIRMKNVPMFGTI